MSCCPCIPLKMYNKPIGPQVICHTFITLSVQLFLLMHMIEVLKLEIESF